MVLSRVLSEKLSLAEANTQDSMIDIAIDSTQRHAAPGRSASQASPLANSRATFSRRNALDPESRQQRSLSAHRGEASNPVLPEVTEELVLGPVLPFAVIPQSTNRCSSAPVPARALESRDFSPLHLGRPNGYAPLRG